METKPGYMTSEFWVTIISSVAAMLVATGVLNPDESSEIVKSVTAIVGGILGLTTAVKYIHDRTQVKVATVHAAAATAQATAQAKKIA